MKLADLERYNPITIQCHDNPDADSIGSGYGLYCYFKKKDKNVRLIYSGSNYIRKSNIKLLIKRLNIPIEYCPPDSRERIEGLLITVDCQYGAGNVTQFEADEVAMIDHHQIENKDINIELCRIDTNMGSCSTLVWSMLREEHYPVNTDIILGTVLYYGLYMDTNQFSELYNPLDMDMLETIPYNKRLIMKLRNSNLSLEELEIAGMALLRYSYNDDYCFAVIKAQPCDPNILGLISDFLIQVDEINTCVVFNEVNDGYKFSVRSCINEVNANELAAFLAGEIGNGGGRYDKSGGFISVKLYEEQYPTLHAEAYFNNRMTVYFDSYTIVSAKDYDMDTTDMQLYQRRQEPVGYVKVTDISSLGSRITVRTQEGDLDMVIENEIYIIIGQHGNVILNNREKFKRYFHDMERNLTAEDYFHNAAYIPTVKDWENGVTIQLGDFMKVCVPKNEMQVYAKKLTKGMKIFAKCDEERYMLGEVGDYVAVSKDDKQNIFIVESSEFHNKYIEV